MPLFKTENLVSNEAYTSRYHDPTLLNAWGLVIDNHTLWVAENHSGAITHYRFNGTKISPTVNVLLNCHTPASPTGMVKNHTNKFWFGGYPSFLIICTEDGLIYGYSPDVNRHYARIVVDNSSTNAVYKGVAIADDKIYAADFYNNKIDVFDEDFNQLNDFPFSDPSIPSGFAPFNIVKMRNKLYVAYALQDSPDNVDDLPGPGNGFINIFTFDGVLVRRFANQGPLNSPWGIVHAPKEFHLHHDKILVGNVGDGIINIYTKAGEHVGELNNGQDPINIEGLWALEATHEKLFYTAGPNDEQDGLLGFIKRK